MLENALGWIGQIADWIGRFIPRWELMDTTEEAVKFIRGGKRVVVCKPGKVHWWWPVTTVWRAHPVVRQTINLKSQTITLKDGKVVIVGGLIVFEIKDVLPLLGNSYNPDETIGDISLSAVHDVCCQYDWTGIQAGQRDGKLDRELKTEARKELDRYGVKVLKMTLTDLAPCRVLKVVQATTKD